MYTKRFSFILSSILLFSIHMSLFGQSSIVLTGSDLRLVSDENTKLVLSDVNLVNNSHADVISGNPELVYTGTNPTSVGGNIATNLNKLTINNSAGLDLGNSITVTNELKLTSGHLKLGDKNLTLGPSATIGGTPGASNMIVASGTGELRKRFASGTYTTSNSPAAFTFPVGTTADGNEYTPVTLDFNSGSFDAQAYVGIRVVDQRSTFMNSAITTNYLNRNWIIEPSGITSPNYNIDLHYVQADWIGTSAGEDAMIPIKYSTHTGTGMWYQPELGGFSNATEVGSGQAISAANILNWESVTSFSQFGGAEGNNQPLPVELVSFTGVCEKGIISLSWQTASEFNSSHFDVEKSRDGENWQLLSTIPSAGTSNELITYQSTDQNGTEGNNYFRLRQVDNDGKEKLYDPINVSCSEVTTGYFSSFPNPSGNSFQVILNNKELIGTCKFHIVDATGKVVENRELEVKDGINMYVINQELTPGIYFLNISNGSKSTPVLRHAVK